MKKILPAISIETVASIFNSRNQIFDINSPFDYAKATKNNNDPEYGSADILVYDPEKGNAVKRICPAEGTTTHYTRVASGSYIGLSEYMKKVNEIFKKKSSYLIYRSSTKRTIFIFEENEKYELFLHIYKEGGTNHWIECNVIYEGVRTYAVERFLAY